MRASFRKNLSVKLILMLVVPLAACGKGDPEQIRQNLHMPKPGYKADAERGRAAFANNCSVCHGTNGQGTGRGPPLLHKTYEPGHHPDMAFHLAVKNGVRQHHWNFGDMPPVSGVTPEQVSDIVAYIRAAQKQAGIE